MSRVDFLDNLLPLPQGVIRVVIENGVIFIQRSSVGTQFDFLWTGKFSRKFISDLKEVRERYTGENGFCITRDKRMIKILEKVGFKLTVEKKDYFEMRY